MTICFPCPNKAVWNTIIYSDLLLYYFILIFLFLTSTNIASASFKLLNRLLNYLINLTMLILKSIDKIHKCKNIILEALAVHDYYHRWLESSNLHVENFKHY
jgi:hypothetical protein